MITNNFAYYSKSMYLNIQPQSSLYILRSKSTWHNSKFSESTIENSRVAKRKPFHFFRFETADSFSFNKIRFFLQKFEFVNIERINLMCPELKLFNFVLNHEKHKIFKFAHFGRAVIETADQLGYSMDCRITWIIVHKHQS